MLQEFVTHIVGDLYETSLNPLKTQELWNYIMKQCISYPEIALIVCALLAQRYPKSRKEIADLISKYNF